MRYTLGFLWACALSALLLVGCGAEALCEGVECEDDGNECTSDECNPATGMCEHVTVEDDTACDFDGLPGLCKAGVCESAMLCEDVVCEDDGNECTDDVCDLATGTCQHITLEDDTACDFGGSPGLCKAGVCVDAMLCEGVECDDDNECSTDVCTPLTGTCAHTPVEDGTGCAGGICRAGECGPLCIANVCHCSEAGIRAAIEGGGDYPYRFNCSGPTTVVTKAEIEIDNDVILDGEGNLTVDGNDTHRVFSVASGVSAELREMTISRGAASGDGGGIHNDGALALTGTTVSSNSAGADGGGIWNQGTLTLVESTVAGNTAFAGGGIENYFGSAELNRSTVSGNTAVAGGGAAIRTGTTGQAVLLLTNTTVSGNFPTPGRGAIENHDEALVISSTLEQLPVGGEGYLWDSGGWVMFMNTILHGQCAGWLPVESYGRNIESPGDTCGLWPYDDWVHVSEAELDLGPLQDNDGPTLTHLPGPSSIAIDRIEPWACEDANWDPLEIDQRGVGRPQGSLCDVGSVEADSLCGGVDCDDQNECTLDRCNPADASCSHDAVPDDPYRYCNFGSGGNGGAGGTGGGGTGGAGGTGGPGYMQGVCFQGECIPDLCWGNPCDDGDPCTIDHCNPPNGSCSYEPVPDDWYMYCELGGGGSGGSGGFGGSGGSGGTGGYVPGICVQGECIENLCWDNPCDDGNDCTWDDCSFPDGSCSYTDLRDGAACMNGTGQCLDGACQLYPYCGEGESIGVGFMTDQAVVSCDGLGVITVPIEVVLAAKPQGAVIDGMETDYDVQIQLILSEDIVDELGNLVLTAVIGESSADVDDGQGGTSLNVPATVPCYIDFTEDPDENGKPGPVVITTPVVVQGWSAIDGGLTLQAPHTTLLITQPVPLNLSTKGDMPACYWEVGIPTVTFESGSGGNGG